MSSSSESSTLIGLLTDMLIGLPGEGEQRDEEDEGESGRLQAGCDPSQKSSLSTSSFIVI